MSLVLGTQWLPFTAIFSYCNQWLSLDPSHFPPETCLGKNMVHGSTKQDREIIKCFGDGYDSYNTLYKQTKLLENCNGEYYIYYSLWVLHRKEVGTIVSPYICLQFKINLKLVFPLCRKCPWMCKTIENYRHIILGLHSWRCQTDSTMWSTSRNWSLRTWCPVGYTRA